MIAFRHAGDPEPEIRPANIPVEDLPHCDCPEKGLLRPAVVWFEESLNPDVLTAADEAVGECDVCLVVGRVANFRTNSTRNKARSSRICT